MKWCRFVIAVVLAVGCPNMAHAVSITLCNTGQGPGCSGTLADGATDPNYTIISGPSGFTGATKTVFADGFQTPAWWANDANSKWIGPASANASSEAAAGFYTYRTAFDLTGLDPNSASITGFWSTDDGGITVILNGIAQGFGTPGASTSYVLGYLFTLNTDFVAGLNTLDFLVQNEPADGLHTGLRVDDISGTAQPFETTPVPEPTTLVLVGIGIAAAQLKARHARSRKR